MIQKHLIILLVVLLTGGSYSQDTTSFDDWKWEVDAGLPFGAWQPYQFSNGVPQYFLVEGKYKLSDQWNGRVGIVGGQGYFEPYFDREWGRISLFMFDAGVEGRVWGTKRFRFMYYGSLMYLYSQNDVGPHLSSSLVEGFTNSSSFVGLSGGVSLQYAITPHVVLSTELGLGYGAFIYDDYDAVCNCEKLTTSWDIFPSRWPSVMIGYRF